MHRYLKFLPLLAVLAFGAVWASWPQSAAATPSGPPTWSGPGANGYFTITASYTDDTPVGAVDGALLTAIGGVGTFVTGTASVAPVTGDTLSMTTTTVNVTDDPDTIPQFKTITVSFQCLAAGTESFTLTQGNTTSATSAVLTCSPFYNNGQQYPTTPYYGGYPGFNPLAPIYNTGVMSLGVSASPASLSCGSTSTIAVSVRDASGNPAPDGTAVSLSASMGTVSPTTGNTYGGAMSGVYTSPSSNGTAVITASSGSASGQATVTVSCAGAATAPSAPPPVYAPPPAIGTAIYPPNTGDAGLASTSNSSNRLPAALAVALTVLAGGALVGGWSYRRERAS